MPSIQYQNDLSKQSKALASGGLAGHQRTVGTAGRRAAHRQGGDSSALPAGFSDSKGQAHPLVGVEWGCGWKGVTGVFHQG